MVAKKSEDNQGDKSLDLFVSLLAENSSRYEKEALALLGNGVLNKDFDGVIVQHFLREGGGGYRLLPDGAEQPEEIFFQSLSEEPSYRLKLLIDQIAQSEVDIAELNGP